MRPPLILSGLRLLSILVVVGWGVTGIAQGPVPGAPKLLPEGTLAYLRVDNANDLRSELRQSSIGQMLNDPDVKPFAGDVWTTTAELFEQFAGSLGMSLDELVAIPQGQIAVALIPGTMEEGRIYPQDEEDSAEEDEGFEGDDDDESDAAIRRRLRRKLESQFALAGVFIVESGEKTESLRTLMEVIEQGLAESGYVRRQETKHSTELIRWLSPRRADADIEWFERDETVVVGIGYQTAASVLDRWAEKGTSPSLAESAEFAAVMSRCVGAEESRPQVTFYADPYHFVERMVKRSGSAPFVWPILENLGISKIRGIGGSTFVGNDEFENIVHFHMLLDPPRDGVFGVLRPTAGDTVPPDWVPEDIAGYHTLTWDIEQAYDNLNKVISQFQGPDPLKRFFEDWVMRETGVEFRSEVLENITGRLIMISWLEPPVRINSQVSIFAVEIKDADAARATMRTFTSRTDQEWQTETKVGNVVYVNRKAAKRELPAGIRRPIPCFTLVGNWLIASDSAEFIERALLAQRGAIGTLANVPEYQLISSELGGKLDGEKPFFVQFVRTSEYFRQAFELIKSEDTRRFLRRAAEQRPTIKKIADLVERNQLPDFDKIEKYFAAGGSFAYDEPTGIHFGSFSLRSEVDE